MVNDDEDVGSAASARPDIPATEDTNSASLGIDELDALGILRVMHSQDIAAWNAVGACLENLSPLVDDVVRAFREGGRLLYFGAGTSGRLGVLDASECPPTFGVDSTLVQGHIAGGDLALRRAVEGAEDDRAAGAATAREASVGPRDVVCGIAASGTTPFVWGALDAARAAGARTALIHCNPRLVPEVTEDALDHLITLDVGPEILAGSTRLKSGTATKLVLNMITTAAMIRSGKVYGNQMVDLVASNQKLRHRALRLVVRITGVEEQQALGWLERAEGSVKAAIVMARGDVSLAEARACLIRRDGRLRGALEEVGTDDQ